MIERDAQRWERAQAIFTEAVELPEVERQSFVKETCGDDRELASQVLLLIEEDERQQTLLDGDPGSELGQIADAALQSDHIRSMVEQQIGPYHLLRVLGEGGMGIVYLAERTDIGGLFAIKLLRDAWMSPMRRERFALEQQTLVKLNHPAIARLYDASTTDEGTPWFVMEFADGRSLTQSLRDNAASVTEGLLLFRRVCEAVRYAHGLAIIHRDLKPSNILVTAEGEIKLLDFGIAKQMTPETQAEAPTIADLRLLSPGYAAPEQYSGGEVGVFTDIYSLGVLLYEILTGNLPESAETRGEKALERPSSAIRKSGNGTALSRQQWADLDVICATALQMEPERRYRSVDALIRDVNAYLEGRVLEARPASAAYTVGKFVRRNRLALASTAAMLVVLTGASVYFTVRLAHARDAAVAEAARTKRIQEFMFNMIGNGDAEAGPGSGLKVATLLDREAQQASTLKGDVETQIDLYGTLGAMYDRLGKFDESEKMLTLAMEKAKQADGPESARVTSLLIQMGTLHGDRDDLKAAEQDVEQAVEIARRNHLGPQEAREREAQIALGRIYLLSGNQQKAIDTLTPIARLEPKPGVIDPDDVRDATSALSIAQLYAHHYDLAETEGRRAIALDRQLLGESHPQTGIDIANLASVRAVQGDLPEAEHLYREGRSIMLAWYGPDHPDVATSSSILARILSLEGKDSEAESLLLAALPIQEKVYGPVHERVSFSLNTLGEIVVRRHEYAAAESDFSRALEIDQALFGEKNYKTAAIRGNLGDVYLKEHKYSLAEATLRQSTDALAVLPPGNNLIGTARARWGSSLLALKRYAEAEAQLTLADQLLRAQHNPPAAQLALVHNDLATLNAATHREIAANHPAGRLPVASKN